MKSLLLVFSLFVGVAHAAPGSEYLCGSGDGVAAFTDAGASKEAASAAVLQRCEADSANPIACAEPVCRKQASAKVMDKLQSFSTPKCDSNDDCPGFANSCFAGKCTRPGYQCDSNDDCPGFANSCFAGKCTRQEPLCDSNDDCPGFANSCFAGKCTNP